jgi:hypothetical protein
MGKIIEIKGNVRRESENCVLLLADERCVFGVEDLSDESNKGTLTWFLKDDKGKEVFKKTGKWNDKFSLTVNKKLSGDYRYQLGAAFKLKSKETVYPTVFIGGCCEPKITDVKTDLPQKVGCGIIRGQITIEAEGLNGNTLDMEIDFADRCYNLSTKCVEGHAAFNVSLNTISFLAELTKNQKKEIEKTLRVRIRDKSGNPVKDCGGKDIVIERKITVSTKEKVNVKVPENKTIVYVQNPDNIENEVKSEVNGIIDLIKVKVNTTYDVCSDTIKDYKKEYKNLWILKEGANYYHWLKKRGDSDDKKPLVLPVTLNSNQSFSFDATFKTLLPVDGDKLKIRVNEKDKGQKDKYQISISVNQMTGQKNKDEEFTVSFASDMPYANSVRYFENYPLFFEYSVDENSWIPLATVRFCIYITKNSPLWGDYDTCIPFSGAVDKLKTNLATTLKILNSGRKYILESLLYISCMPQLPNKMSNQVVVDNIFKVIKDLHVKRARNTEDLGYWRCSSALDPSKFFPIRSEDFTEELRSVRFLLRVGDGRCGEWAQFFRELCLTQGIPGIKQLDFKIDPKNNKYKNDGKDYISNVFLMKTWTISDPHRPVDKGCRAQGNNKPLNVFKSHVFCVYEGVFYDPSYGLKGREVHTSGKSVLAEYCRAALQSIPFSIIDKENGEEFYDQRHSGCYMDPQQGIIPYPDMKDVPKLKYLNINVEMETYFHIYAE